MKGCQLSCSLRICFMACCALGSHTNGGAKSKKKLGKNRQPSLRNKHADADNPIVGQPFWRGGRLPLSFYDGVSPNERRILVAKQKTVTRWTRDGLLQTTSFTRPSHGAKITCPVRVPCPPMLGGSLCPPYQESTFTITDAAPAPARVACQSVVECGARPAISHRRWRAPGGR